MRCQTASSHVGRLSWLAAAGLLLLPCPASARAQQESVCHFSDAEIRPHMRSGAVGAVLGTVVGGGLGFLGGVYLQSGENFEGGGGWPGILLGVGIGGTLGGFLGFQVSAVTRSRAESQLRNECLRNAVRRAQQAAAEVDTIIVHPDSLLLRVGERIPIYTLVSVEARSRAGDRVSDFAALWLIEDDQIALLDAGQLIGRTPGETRLIIRPFAGDPNVRVRPIQALVLIRVSP